MEPRLAIVILNWNGKAHLKEYLPSVTKFSNTGNVQIYIADNGSTDDSIAFLNENYPSLKIIQLDQNYGFAEGYNKALTHINAEYFCLLNSDVRVTQNWYQPVLEILAKNENIAAVQPKILSDRNHQRFEHAGAAGGFIDKYAYPFCRGRIMDNIEDDHGQYDKSTSIFWASGACMFIKSDAFKKVGGFDGKYFAHMEEIDLCWRIKNYGYQIIYCPESTIYHYGGATLDYNNPRKLFLNFRNSLWTLYKNHTGKNLNSILFKRKLIDGFAAIKFLLTFEFKNAFAILKAHLEYYRSKPELKQQRKAIQEKTVSTNHPEILNHSIVWQFFLKGKKKFSDLTNFPNPIH